MLTDDETAFLRSRLDEDEAAAKAARSGPWTAEPIIYGPPEDGWGDPEDAPWEIRAGERAVASHQPHEGGGVDGGANARHIARHDPARALREVDRKLIDLYGRSKSYRDRVFARPEPRSVSDEMRAVTQMLAVEQVLRLRAAIWSDHPDYPIPDEPAA